MEASWPGDTLACGAAPVPTRASRRVLQQELPTSLQRFHGWPKGSAVTRWSRKDPRHYPANSAYHPRELGAAIFGRYPFLRAPAVALANPAGLDRMARIAKPEMLLTHRLMNIEAEALTLAMRALRNDWRRLALLLHDGLIIQERPAAGGAATLWWGRIRGRRRAREGDRRPVAAARRNSHRVTQLTAGGLLERGRGRLWGPATGLPPAGRAWVRARHSDFCRGL